MKLYDQNNFLSKFHIHDFCPEMHPNDQAWETVRKHLHPSLFSFFDPTFSHCDSASVVASYHVEPVIKLSSNPLMFRKNKKVIYKFFRLPATRAPVERVFLKAGKITKADRSRRMSSSLLEKIVFLACNSQ